MTRIIAGQFTSSCDTQVPKTHPRASKILRKQYEYSKTAQDSGKRIQIYERWHNTYSPTPQIRQSNEYHPQAAGIRAAARQFPKAAGRLGHSSYSAVSAAPGAAAAWAPGTPRVKTPGCVLRYAEEVNFASTAGPFPTIRGKNVSASCMISMRLYAHAP